MFFSNVTELLCTFQNGGIVVTDSGWEMLGQEYRSIMAVLSVNIITQSNSIHDFNRIIRQNKDMLYMNKI